MAMAKGAYSAGSLEESQKCRTVVHNGKKRVVVQADGLRVALEVRLRSQCRSDRIDLGHVTPPHTPKVRPCIN